MNITIATWSIEEYHRMIKAEILKNRHVELLNGKIVNMPPEGPEHAQLTTDTADYLRSLLGESALIRDAKPITITATNSEPEPDIAIVSPNRTLYRQRHPYPEEIFWVIEYANTSLSKDLNNKRVIYAIAGIKEYWLVDLKNRQVKVWREVESSDYKVQLTLTKGEISPLAFPKITVSISQLLGK